MSDMVELAHPPKSTGSRRAAPRRATRASNDRTQSIAVEAIGPGGRLDIDHVAEVFHMTRGQLAETVGLARDTLQKTSRRDAPKTQARVGEMLEILSRVEAWAGGLPQAMAWYRAQPIPALDGRTAEALVKDGQATLVRDYLDHLAVGGFA
jgi:uncharacterized protein (DUF2384 family)